MNANPHNIRDGEVLPVVGGPRDGGVQTVTLLFGQLPSAGIKFGSDEYKLDAANRRWVYVGKDAK